MSGPLQGLRVVDLTAQLAGPYGTMLLADLGADVIKVEPPRGDAMRRLEGWRWRPGDEPRASGRFETVNRGKRSIVLDLTTDEGADTLLALVAGADALVESFEVGVMEDLGLAYERLRGINPRLVYASTRRFGDPRTGAPRYPIDARRRSPADEPPLSEIFPAALMTLGIVAALLHAQQNGEGQYVGVSSHDTLAQLGELLDADARPGPGRPPAETIAFTATPAQPSGRAPELDEHGDDVRRDLAWASTPLDDDLEDGLEMI